MGTDAMSPNYETYDLVRRVNDESGRIAAIRFIRRNVVENYLVALTYYNDCVSRRPWTVKRGR